MTGSNQKWTGRVILTPLDEVVITVSAESELEAIQKIEGYFPEGTLVKPILKQ